MSNETINLIPSGKSKIDGWLNGGYEVPSITLVASRTGAGKTKWLLESALSNAQNGINALHVSLVNSIEANIDFLVYIYGLESMEQQASQNLHLAELENGSLRKLESLIEENVLLNNVEIVYIDGIKPISSSYGSDFSLYDANSQALEALSKLSKRHNVPIVIEQTITSVNDIGEPENLMLSDVSMENSLKHVNVVISLFREKKFTNDSKKQVNVQLLKSPHHNLPLEYKETFIFFGDNLLEKSNLD